MGYVYLIGEIGNEGKYKIGSTRAKSVDKRLKQLQTGNSSALFIKELYETEHPFKLEKMLHNRFKSHNLIGEWFELSEANVGAFKGICDDYMRIIESLENNPFYFKK
jgi:mRNA-degrading endonuclease YafQ of YafQ-DinJ toxin-antitoxin module